MTHTHVATRTIAAAWRENLNHIRNRTTINGDHHQLNTASGPLHFTATHSPFNHLTLHQPPTLNGQPAPADDILTAITGQPTPTHLTADFASAVHGHQLATNRATTHRDTLATTVATSPDKGLAHYTAALQPHQFDHHITRHLEPLATGGHWLHALARTRLGWKPHDFTAYDLETTEPLNVPLVRAQGLKTAGHPIPGLIEPDGDATVLPIHPWQLQHLRHRHPELFTDKSLTLTGDTLTAWPTASIRTLHTPHRSGFVKLSLGIRITSTDRGISPTTARLAPKLSRKLNALQDPILKNWRFLTDTASAWHPHSRDITAIARSSLAEVTPPGTTPVPALALPCPSPTATTSLAGEYISWAASQNTCAPQVAAQNWLEKYVRLLLPPALHLSAHFGIGIEGHQQNTLIAFNGPHPEAVIVRDLGGIRLWKPQLPFTVNFPDNAPIATTDRMQTHRKVAFTVIHNHLGAVIEALVSDSLIKHQEAWAIVADLIAQTDIPAQDRDYYFAATLPTKAMLTMRLRQTSDQYLPVDNPLHAHRERRRAP
ncbi:IucA/IucC family protein [Natronoglycomyces albus]|uniref:Uncharacterized protein n=1 Tax=Natronoglycomyces albus TaxID=2811108 RepID=A0A895XX34_9ACTN|nr:IucA/IucC family protein [Natronoglycomyces albus]QSB06780.1 hypothetical protein JQS30_07795 [Natronoglycomyces albus]